MNDAEIVEALRLKLDHPGGRHLYGVLGTYRRLADFSKTFQQARTVEGEKFPPPLSLSQLILAEIPDERFRELVADEAKRPEPVARHVGQAFESVLRKRLRGKGLIVFDGLEILFAYGLELNLLRTMAADSDRVLLLLPGLRRGNAIVLYPGYETGPADVGDQLKGTTSDT